MRELGRVTSVPAYAAEIVINDIEMGDWPPSSDSPGAVGNGEAIRLTSETIDHRPTITLALNENADDVTDLEAEWSSPIAINQPLTVQSDAVEVRDIFGSEIVQVPIPNGDYAVTVFRKGADELRAMHNRGEVRPSTTADVEKWLLLFIPR